MKLTSLTFGCSLLLAMASAPSFALNEVHGQWYAMTLNGVARADVTLGCLDNKMMYEKHEFQAVTWDQMFSNNGFIWDMQWDSSPDDVFIISLFNNQRQPGSLNNAPVHSFDTARLHNSDGSTVDAEGNKLKVASYAIRPYEAITSVKSLSEKVEMDGDVLNLDPQCHFL